MVVDDGLAAHKLDRLIEKKVEEEEKEEEEKEEKKDGKDEKPENKRVGTWV